MEIRFCISKLLLTVFKGLNLLREAEQYLAQAQWVVLQTPNCDPAIKSKLYRDLGLLFIAQGNTIDAKKHFAEDVSHGASLQPVYSKCVSLIDLSFFCCAWTTPHENSWRVFSFRKRIPFRKQTGCHTLSS